MMLFVLINGSWIRKQLHCHFAKFAVSPILCCKSSEYEIIV